MANHEKKDNAHTIINRIYELDYDFNPDTNHQILNVCEKIQNLKYSVRKEVISSILSSFENVLDSINESTIRKSTIEASLNEKDSEINDIKVQLESERETFQKSLEELRQEIEAIEEDKKELSNKLKCLNTKYTETVKEKKKITSDLQSQITALKAQPLKLENTQKKIEIELRQKINALEKEKRGLEREISTITADRTKVQKTKISLENELQNISTKSKKEKKENLYLKAQISSLNAERAQLEDKFRDEISKLGNENRELAKEKEKLDRIITISSSSDSSQIKINRHLKRENKIQVKRFNAKILKFKEKFKMVRSDLKNTILNMEEERKKLVYELSLLMPNNAHTIRGTIESFDAEKKAIFDHMAVLEKRCYYWYNRFLSNNPQGFNGANEAKIDLLMLQKHIYLLEDKFQELNNKFHWLCDHHEHMRIKLRDDMARLEKKFILIRQQACPNCSFYIPKVGRKVMEDLGHLMWNRIPEDRELDSNLITYAYWDGNKYRLNGLTYHIDYLPKKEDDTETPLSVTSLYYNAKLQVVISTQLSIGKYVFTNYKKIFEELNYLKYALRSTRRKVKKLASEETSLFS